MENNRVDEYVTSFLSLLNDNNVLDVQITDNPTIGDGFRDLGFDMDCGHIFEGKYGRDAYSNPDALENVIDSIDDIYILGSAIFSKWRYYSHWAMGESIRDEEAMRWFNMTIKRMQELTRSKAVSNSDNPKNGAEFQRPVQNWFIKKYGQGFELEKKIPIGNPAKDHKFDIVHSEKKIAIECKRYTWTVTGNVPSAKMGFTNEAAFYLSFLPDDYEKYIVMMRSLHEKRSESLAEYYFRTNKHLIGKIKIAEYDPECDGMIIIS